MSDKEKSQSTPADAVAPPEFNNAEFQFALSALLAAYQPALERQLNLIKNPQELQKQLQTSPASCADEFAEAYALFEKFLTEDVALRLLPAQARELLGPIERWRWCFLHIRCCIVFGWLVCRWPRTFRGYAFYLYEYWKCVRQVVGNPVSNPPTEEQRRDFEILVKVLAEAFKPYLTDQLATVEFPQGVPDEVISGKIDCFIDEQEACVIFERLLTAEAARALLGEEAFKVQSQQNFFWFCRCWCLCGLCFGCCLARSRNILQVVYCLLYYWRCIRECFRPLTCNLNQLPACVPDELNQSLGAFVIEIKGTAAGLGFDHYLLEWSTDNINFFSTFFFYPPIPPGNPGPGTAPVVNGLLADFDTTLQNPGLNYYIRMTVFSNTGAKQICTIPSFQLLKTDVFIRGIDNYFTLDTDPTDPAAKFIENVPLLCSRPASVSEVSFGDRLSVQGGAFVGICSGVKVKQYLLDYKPGFESDCNSLGWQFLWKTDYGTPLHDRFPNWRVGQSYLTATWGADCSLPNLGGVCSVFWGRNDALLYNDSWPSNIGGCLLNGLYTFRLTVIDTNNVKYCDTQSLWIDNKYPCGAIRIDAVPKCADLFISQFAKPPDCGTPWALPLSGIAFDPLIDEAALPNRPNDNFDFYYVQIEKQAGPTVQIPIPGPDVDPDPAKWCFNGVSRVGDPLHHCNSSVCDPNNLDPMAVFGQLAQFDLRALDPACRQFVKWGPDPNLTIARGDCCVYIFKVWVYDRTIRPGGQHSVYGYGDWPVKICNDLQS